MKNIFSKRILLLRARKNSYEEALNICERDKKWLKESMDRLKESIRNKIEKLNSMMEC